MLMTSPFLVILLAALLKSGLDQANLEHYVLLCDHLKSKSDEVMKNVIQIIFSFESMSCIFLDTSLTVAIGCCILINFLQIVARTNLNK